MEGPFVILIDCMIFLSPFVHVIRIFISAVSGLVLFLISCSLSYRKRCRLHGYSALYIHSMCCETSPIFCYSGKLSYSDKLHYFSVIISRCYENLYASSFWAGVIFNFMLDKLLKQMEVIWLYHSKCWETSICCYSGRPSYSDRLHDFSVTIPRC